MLLQLGCDKQKVIWQNTTPSSSRYCRLIRIRFVKEIVDITQKKIKSVKNAISFLQNTLFTLEDKCYSVKHIMAIAMVNANMCNAVTQTTSTIWCYICGATSKKFNNKPSKKMLM